MPGSRKELQHSNRASGNISILFVGREGADVGVLRGMLQHEALSIATCSRCCEAVNQLDGSRPRIVLCDRDLPDGSWQAVFRETCKLDPAPLLLVASWHADESLWTEVLTAGGYDVLPRPFERADVTRILAMASGYESIAAQ